MHNGFGNGLLMALYGAVLMTTHTVLPAAGVDVGFFSTKFAFHDSTGQPHTGLFPSLAPISMPIQDLPSFNRPDGCTVDIEGTPFFVGAGAPQMMDGTGLIRSASTDYSLSRAYRALFLGALWHIARAHKLGDRPLKIERLAVGLPMSAMRTHAQSLAEMCAGPHLIPGVADPSQSFKVSIGKVHVLSQPQGSMLNLLARDPEAARQNILVADMGGGTFDWFLSERMGSVIARSGSHGKGMLNCATDVCNRVAPDSVGNTAVLARFDEALRLGKPTVRVMGTELDITGALSPATTIVMACLEQMQKSVGDFGFIDRVILAGGGAPFVRRVWVQHLPKLASLLEPEDDPVFSNVLGFLAFARRAHQAAMAKHSSTALSA